MNAAVKGVEVGDLDSATFAQSGYIGGQRSDVRFVEHRASTLAYWFVSHGAREVVLVSFGCFHGADLVPNVFQAGRLVES
jgi:hypothetical protein